ncbi:hypothetical protein QZH41_004410 [Actinostola sp. cb2023]|nr:hypothetical protein QZH41_004410 [Actinostola sp. cb2023]
MGSCTNLVPRALSSRFQNGGRSRDPRLFHSPRSAVALSRIGTVMIFPDKTGYCWTFIRGVFYCVTFLAHIGFVVTFLSFFVTALSFSVNCALELVLEMITPTGDSTIAWVVAFISSILCSLLLLCFVYNTVYAAADDQVDDDDGVVDKGRKEEGGGFVIQKKVVLLMSVVLIVIFCMALTINTTCGEECQLGPPTKSSSHMLGYNSMKYPPRVPGYPICNKKWSGLPLEITDMAFLAATAYKISTNKTNIRNIVNDYFKDRNINWVVESVNAKKPFFFHIRNSAKKVNIFSIRGTVDLRDWFENAKIWNEIAVFQLISVALPVQHLPFEFVAFFISISSSVDYLLHRSTYTQYFKLLEDYVKAEYNMSEEYFLVGHSLGGGLAKIIGSRNKIPAIAISSPGEIYNHVKFNYTLEDVQKYTTTVRAQNDPVTWIDRSGGLVQYVECANSGYVGEGCHPIKNTYCELKKKCHVTSRINYCPAFLVLSGFLPAFSASSFQFFFFFW